MTTTTKKNPSDLYDQSVIGTLYKKVKPSQAYGCFFAICDKGFIYNVPMLKNGAMESSDFQLTDNMAFTELEKEELEKHVSLLMGEPCKVLICWSELGGKINA